MPRTTCSICSHGRRAEIDSALVRGIPFKTVARDFNVGRMAVWRHNDAGHVLKVIAKAHEASEAARGDDLLEQVRSLQRRAEGLLSRSERKGNVGDATRAIRELRSLIELLARLVGELKTESVTLVVSAEWIEVKTVILASLLEYPQALQAVETALGRMKNV